MYLWYWYGCAKGLPFCDAIRFPDYERVHRECGGAFVLIEDRRYLERAP